MAHQVLYRKYRSTNFEELVGQDQIVKTLQNSIKNGDFAHAYLFCGPRGTGKTSTARLFAKALNCEQGIGSICNECENCSLINEGSHPDVIEIDAASNSRVEEMRNVIEKVKYAPIKGRYKIYIIDEVHMLSNSAFNSLLKTLEEPPENVIFILATTEVYKVLPTIVSRCQRFDFSKIGPKDMKQRIYTIIEAEGISIEPKALDEIVSLSDGCMRDALTILDQLVAFTNSNITYEDTLQVFGLISLNEQTDFLTSILVGDVKDVLLRYKKYIAAGSNILKLTNELMILLKDIIIFKTTNSFNLLERIPDDKIPSLSSSVSLQRVNYVLNSLLDSIQGLKNSADINSLFEILLLKISSINTAEPTCLRNSIKEIKTINNQTISTKEEPKTVQAEQVSTNLVASREQVKKDEASQKPDPKQKKEIKSLLKEPDPYVEPKEVSDNIKPDLFHYDEDILIKALVKSVKQERLSIKNNWEQVRAYRQNLTYAKFVQPLMSSELFSCCDELIIISTNYESIIQIINDKKNEVLLKELFGKIFGTKAQIYCISTNESYNLYKSYCDLNVLNKLPKKSEIGSIFKK